MMNHRNMVMKIPSIGKVYKTSIEVYEIHCKPRVNKDMTEDVGDNCTVALFFMNPSSLGKNDVRKVLKYASSIKHIIIFTPDISQQAVQVLESAQDYFTEILNHSDVAFDKCKSILVPTYRILTEEEVLQFEKDHCVTVDKLPKMLRSDAMARYLGFREGQVVFAIEENNYRIVVSG